MSENENLNDEQLKAQIEKEAEIFAKQQAKNEAVEEAEVIEEAPKTLGKAQKFLQQSKGNNLLYCFLFLSC